MDEDGRLITVTTAQADTVFITFDKLFRNDVVSKERIFYKYLKDTVEFLCNPLQHYDADVKKKKLSVVYLDESKNYKFIRRPIGYDQGKCLKKTTSLLLEKAE